MPERWRESPYHEFMTSNPPDLLRQLFDVQYRASRAQVEVPAELRRDRLQRVRVMLDRHAQEFSKAVEADFGVRSGRLTEVADLLVLRSLLAHSRKSLARWMRPQKVRTPLHLQPSRAYLLRQPLGVVGVVAPWNYPLQLAIAPAITALAAGNRVMLKPSEMTPRTSAALAERIGQLFSTDEWAVVQGGPEVAQSFVSLPFDHLIFTGSTEVGRRVAAAAAANLTPTTLELGGKSPCILDPSADLESAVLKIAHGKLLNAGQTCIAPDYVLVPRSQEAEFSRAYGRAVARLFPPHQRQPRLRAHHQPAPASAA
jgi:coniferyl-aldehyde dehydrogenase